MKLDARGFWFWIPAGLLLGSFFVPQPAEFVLRAVAGVLFFGIMRVVRQRSPSFGRKTYEYHYLSDDEESS